MVNFAAQVNGQCRAVVKIHNSPLTFHLSFFCLNVHFLYLAGSLSNNSLNKY